MQHLHGRLHGCPPKRGLDVTEPSRALCMQPRGMPRLRLGHPEWSQPEMPAVQTAQGPSSANTPVRAHTYLIAATHRSTPRDRGRPWPRMTGSLPHARRLGCEAASLPHKDTSTLCVTFDSAHAVRPPATADTPRFGLSVARSAGRAHGDELPGLIALGVPTDGLWVTSPSLPFGECLGCPEWCLCRSVCRCF